ncbi:MAG: biotin/lipoyl-binding protein, partial [Pseudomonas sp.]|nr:biotin/lipoyl-binding protein [Pseudomonas sp.]
MNAPLPGMAERVFALFLGLEQQARKAANTEQLAFSMVNDGQALFGFRHAALLIAGKVQALTSISVVEAHSPFVAFVERATSTLLKHERLDEGHNVDPTHLDEQARADMADLSAPHAYWLPLKNRSGETFGGLWLARDTPFSEAEQSLLRQLADTYAHAWLALQPRKPWRMRWPRKKLVAVAAALSLLLLIPVRQSVLAPAEVVPLGGRVVAAPLDGVIAEFLVKPNQSVAAGDLLVRF